MTRRRGRQARDITKDDPVNFNVSRNEPKDRTFGNAPTFHQTPRTLGRPDRRPFSQSRKSHGRRLFGSLSECHAGVTLGQIVVMSGAPWKLGPSQSSASTMALRSPKGFRRRDNVRLVTVLKEFFV
jgi:hypothetical protein